MKVAVVLEHVFQRTGDGRVWTVTMFPHAFWRRYLAVFDGVVIVARVRDIPGDGAGLRRVDGDGVTLHGIPDYHGPLGFARRRGAVRAAALSAARPDRALILRVPSPIAGTLAGTLRARGQPFGVEVVTDPWDTFSPAGPRHPLRAFLRWHFTGQLRRQYRAACAAAYVTERSLQARYPTPIGVPAVGVSDVELPAEAIVDAPPRPRTGAALRWVIVASLSQHHKGHDVLAHAVAAAVGRGADLTVDVVGEGGQRPLIAALVERLGVARRFVFHGAVSAGAPVRALLDAADGFVLPSRAEGLSRALVEAMARGLPCIASRVGGNPELLAEEDLVAPGDAADLARALIACTDPARRARSAARNLIRARDFADHRLRGLREDFQRAVAERTAAWPGRGAS